LKRRIIRRVETHVRAGVVHVTANPLERIMGLSLLIFLLCGMHDDYSVQTTTTQEIPLVREQKYEQ
jgi:hypothetical protein